jgi:hypothetical protein
VLTTDRRIRIQQNVNVYRIALVALTGSTKWSGVRRHADWIAAVVSSTTAGSYWEVEIPLEPKCRRTCDDFLSCQRTARGIEQGVIRFPFASDHFRRLEVSE